MHDLHQSRSGIPSFPLVRIWLCGPMTIEWVDPHTGLPLAEQPGMVQNKDWSMALSLLALLLCQPHRRASRDWIMEQFWPESTRSTASHRLETIHSSLSKLLPPQPDGKSLFQSIGRKKASGVVYQLEAYPKIWVDRDALLWNVEQAARMERFGDDPSPYWERAFELGKRGTFLVDEPYAEWAQGPREQVKGAYRQCVHALARLYQQRHGEAGKEEALHLLRSYWLEHKTNEDVLRSLMELLGEQERYQEAEDYYQQSVQALAEHLDQQPDQRTQDLSLYLRTKQTRRSTQKDHLTVSSLSSDLPSSFPRRINQAAMPAFPPQRTLDETPLTQEITSVDMMHTRRQFLHQLLIVSSAHFVLAPYTHLPFEGQGSIIPPDLEEITRITESYWRICTNASLDLLGALSEHFRLVTTLLQRVSPGTHAHSLSSLAGESAQMLGKTLFDGHEYTLAWQYYVFSLKAAQAASNSELWAVGLGRMAQLLLYWKQPQQALTLFQDVHQVHLEQTRVLCWLAVVEAEIYAHLGKRDACEHALNRARTHLNDEPLGDDRYATGFNASRFAAYEGACFVRLRQPDRALPALEQALTLLDASAIRRQSTVLTDMGIAYAQQGQMQRACHAAFEALVLTTQTRSHAVLERVRSIHTELAHWKVTDEVQELETQLQKTALSLEQEGL